MKKIFVLLNIFYSFSFAQVTWSPTYNLSNTPSATSDYHSVCSDGFGHYYVVWGDNGEIKFKRSFDYGETWFPNVTLYLSSNVCGYPVIKADNNFLYVVYHQLAGDYEILFQYSTDSGDTWSTVQGLSGMDSGSITPQLSAFANNIFVVWEQKINNVADIYFIKSTDWGSTWSQTQNISNTLTSQSRWVQLEYSFNTIYCAWIESANYPISDIYFSKSTDGGNSWSTPFNITNDSRPHSRIFMTLKNDNQIYIASDDIITFNFDEIYLLKSSDGGSTWSTPKNITNNPGNSNTPCINFWGDFLYFTWSDNSHTAPAFDNMDTFFKWSSDDGVTWQDSINISNNSETSSRPRICSGINGPIGFPWIEMTIIWYDYSTGDAELLARRGAHYFVPVELTSFNANVSDVGVTLNWATATETNNSGFEIQRLKDSKIEKLDEWEIIGFINGHGTTTEPQTYFYKDKNLTAGKYEYRLKQIDFDGTFEYSNIIETEILTPAKFSLEQNYPNPFNPSTDIQYAIASKQFVSLKVFNSLGEEIATLVNEEKPAGNHTIEFKPESSIKNLVSGVYLYQLIVGNFIQTKKMILLK